MTIEQARLAILPADMQERFEEMAAIYEYEGEIPREDAELLAFEYIELSAK